MADEKQNVRDQLYLAVKEAQAEKVKKIEDVFGSRQEVKEQIFSSDTLLSNNLLVPPYDPDKMYSVAESSGILPQCIDAMVQNIDGFGYEFKYTGDTEEEDSKEALNELTNLKAFFDMVNEEASFRVVRLSLRRDIETTGNGYLEVIRFLDGDIATIYPMDARLVRLQAKQEVPYKYNVDLFRNGKVRSVPISKRFRKFAMRVSKSEQRNLRWFKEFGDPRKMCAVSGKYEDDLGPNEKIIEEASEVIHFKIGHGTYGVPRWSGQVTNVLGMTSADYVNWDLFENQVVPPLVVMVSGGTLTAESIRDIQRILIQKRGIENFNKVLILEAQSEGNITDKSSTKIELKEMSVSRKEDAMFAMYVEKGEQRVRSSFRISPMLAGRAEVYSRSSADAAKMTAEEQIFIPERATFDEIINIAIIPNIGGKYWKFQSKGPRLITGKEIVEGFKEFSKEGIFTINEGIRLANRLLNMDITLYKETWADYPIPFILELIKQGKLTELDAIKDSADTIIEKINRNNLTPEEKISIVDVFNNLENLTEEIKVRRSDKA